MLLQSFCAFLSLLVTPSLAFFQNFFHQQEPQKPIVFNYLQEFQRGTSRGNHMLALMTCMGCSSNLSSFLPSLVECQQGYTCPGTLACVAKPADCPCPHEGIDLKCPLPGAKDGEYVCARDCAKVKASLKI
ncbi:BQ2448_5422 [Microbotryum intermedium]|uniref:BQ2448_5422 protein n=1 Tax=Microbotryum intermedium TaxID=269621 RepID=A0A238F6V6_9BASI|nr:BQ2448_5422 [Microbotryum intermedium]